MRITVDLTKASTEIVDLSSKLNPRVGDGGLTLPFHVLYGDNVVDMHDKDIEFISQDPDGHDIYVSGTVDTSTPGDNAYQGDVTFKFPNGTFKKAGTYDTNKTMFRIVNKSDNSVISTVNVKLTVLDDGSTEFNFDPTKTGYNSRMEDMLNDFKEEHDKKIASINQEGQQAADDAKAKAEATLDDVKDKAKQSLADITSQAQQGLNEIKQLSNEAKGNVAGDTAATAKQAKEQATMNAGLLHDHDEEISAARGRYMKLADRENAQDDEINRKEDRQNANENYAALQMRDDAQDKEIAKKASQRFIINELSKMVDHPQYFKDINAVELAYPTGGTQLIVLENGHRAIYQNGKWTEGTAYEAAGPDPEILKGLYKDAVNPIMRIRDYNLLNFYDLTYATLDDKTGDYLPNENFEATDYIPVEQNTTYYLRTADLPDSKSSISDCKIGFYGISKEFLEITDGIHSFTTTPDTFFIKVSFPTSFVSSIFLEKGDQFTSYRDSDFKISPDLIGSITTETFNLLNLDDTFAVNYGLDSEGNFIQENGVSTFDFINLKGAKKLSFSIIPKYIAFYDKDLIRVGNISTWPHNGCLVPDKAIYMRVSYENEKFNTSDGHDDGKFLQISPAEFLCEPSWEKETVLKNVLIDDYRKPKFHLQDALNQWIMGNKFPVGFLGDSTTEGDNTSDWSDANQHIAQDRAAGGVGKIDYINKTSYSYILQGLLRERTHNNSVKIYNMGWSGTEMDWMLDNLGSILNGAYNDVRMVGIAYGINDRNNYLDRDSLSQGFRFKLIRLIKILYDKGIQPFIVTSQAVWQHSKQSLPGDLLSSQVVTTIINRVKKEVAKEYNLEIIDMQEVGDLIAKYSSVGWNGFNNGILHFKDLGHQAEARYIYGKFTDEIEEVESGSVLSYLSQRVLSTVYYGDNLQTADNDFKYTANLNTSGKQLLQQFSVMNSHPQALQLVACCSTPDGQTVEVDGTIYQITNAEQEITKLEPGAHIIRAFNDPSKTTTNWLGFKLK